MPLHLEAPRMFPEYPACSFRISGGFQGKWLGVVSQGAGNRLD